MDPGLFARSPGHRGFPVGTAARAVLVLAELGAASPGAGRRGTLLAAAGGRRVGCGAAGGVDPGPGLAGAVAVAPALSAAGGVHARLHARPRKRFSSIANWQQSAAPIRPRWMRRPSSSPVSQDGIVCFAEVRRHETSHDSNSIERLFDFSAAGRWLARRRPSGRIPRTRSRPIPSRFSASCCRRSGWPPRWNAFAAMY